MKLILFLFRWSKSVRYARATIAAIMFAAVLGGIGSTVLIVAINSALQNREHSTATLAQVFIACCVAVPIARFFSQTQLERLTAGAALKLRLELSRRILSSPLRLLEETEPHNPLDAL